MKLIFGNRRNSSSSFCRTYRTAQGPWRCREGLLRGPTGGHARAQQATALAQQMRAPLGKRGVVALSKAASIPFPVLLGAIQAHPYVPAAAAPSFPVPTSGAPGPPAPTATDTAAAAPSAPASATGTGAGVVPEATTDRVLPAQVGSGCWIVRLPMPTKRRFGQCPWSPPMLCLVPFCVDLLVGRFAERWSSQTHVLHWYLTYQLGLPTRTCGW